MKKFDVLCPHCNGVFLETTEHFTDKTPANGSMFKAVQHIVDAGWSVFPLYDSTEYDDIVCPSCGGTLVDSTGRVVRMVENGECTVTPKKRKKRVVKKKPVVEPDTKEEDKP